MNTFIKSGNPEDIAIGKSVISAGKVGCIVLAGGEGSRLGWNGPKGTFPLFPERQKTLFQLLMQRHREAGHLFKQELKLAVMTSPNNDAATRKALPDPIALFSQKMLPLLDEKKRPTSLEGPNGNGEVLKCFYESGLYEKWKQSGIEYIQVIPIDNPLAEPFDANQIGIHFRNDAEVTLKAIEKKTPDEKVGVVGKKEGKICIIEYCENPSQEWNLANANLFSFRMKFVEKVKDISLPLHIVKKIQEGKTIYKQEYFIFDLLMFSEKTEVIVYKRDEIFAPLKSKDDIKSVQEALSRN